MTGSDQSASSSKSLNRGDIMSKLEIRKVDITSLDFDCIVNAANSGLMAGGGVCGAIFRAAGYNELHEACDKIGGCPTGSAVITPGFNLKAKYIIHTAGPIWRGGSNGEAEALYSCYQSSMRLAMENGCKTIAFPLISSGIYGYPQKEAWEIAIKSIRDFQEAHKDYRLDAVIAVIADSALSLGKSLL